MSDKELTPIFDAIKSQVVERFGPSVNVGIYEPQKGKKIKTPAVLIELVDMKTGQRNTGGKVAVNVEFVAHCILSFKTENVSVEVANFAAAFLLLLHQQKWGLSFVEYPQDQSASLGMFKPDSDGFESMAVSWVQPCHIGDEWVLPDDMPDGAFFSFAPEIGLAHQDDYVPIDDQAGDL